MVLAHAATQRRLGRRRAEEPEHGGQHGAVAEEAQVAAAEDEEHSAAWAVSGTGRRDERVVGAEDRELLRGEPVAEVR